MAQRCGPSTTACGGGPPPHRKSMGRIYTSAPHPQADIALKIILSYIIRPCQPSSSSFIWWIKRQAHEGRRGGAYRARPGQQKRQIARPIRLTFPELWIEMRSSCRPIADQFRLKHVGFPSRRGHGEANQKRIIIRRASAGEML